MKLFLKYHIITLFLLIVFILTTCTKDKGKVLQKSNAICDTLPATYANDIRPIVNVNCLSGCHVSGGSASTDFSIYGPLKEDADNGQLKNRVIVIGDMPPAGALPDSVLQKIDCWIQKGALNN